MKKLFGAAVAAALLQAPAHAQDLDWVLNGIDFSFGGYGTAGLVRSSTDSAEFISGTEASGAKTSPVENVDSNLGVQATARFNSWLSATMQVFTSHDVLTEPVSWAYLKVDPVTNLTFKLGKVEMPLFAISDSRDIGYANVWLRAPNEVYTLASLKELRGGEVSYSLPLGPTHLTLTGYAGDANARAGAAFGLNAEDVHGGEVRWESEWVTLRAGFATAMMELAPTLHDRYSFTGYGALMDHNNIIAQAEVVRRKSAGYAEFVSANGYYVMGGYRFGKVAPYASYAKTKKWGSNADLGAITFNQNTTALGVRWDAFKSADLKFQLERVDPEGNLGISFVDATSGFGNSKVTVASLTLDFVF
jgi:hypothetical protein